MVLKEDLLKLKRDYIKNPLNISTSIKSEKPFKEDLEYLYITLNYSENDLLLLFKVSSPTFRKWCKFYNIIKDKNLVNKNISKGILNKSLEDKDYWAKRRNKTQQTCLDKYGKKYYLSTEEFKNKSKLTCLNKYNTDYIFKSNNFKEKSKQTKLNKYNNENYNNREKAKLTCLEKYGRISTIDYNKAKETCLKRYGVDNYSKSNNFKDFYNKNKNLIKQKEYNTKKVNNSFNSSKPEEEIYKLLVEKFGKNNIERQYRSDLYPFNCDFYISKENIYIEYQGFWYHYKKPYNSKDKECIDLIELWKSKDTKFYNKAIEVYTIRDPLKRKVAKENNLNWIEFFNMKEFLEWYNNI